MGEKLEAWAKLIPEPWGDNRMIGSLSNTEHLTFNLKSSETSVEQQAIGVISRNVTVSIEKKVSQGGHKSYNYTRDVVFTIKAFSEDQSCVTLKAETNVTIGCPGNRHIIPRGKPTNCDSFRNYSYVLRSDQQKHFSFANREVSDKTIEYDFDKLGCPLRVQNNEPFRPVIHLYDRETFVKEVDVNYIMWEQHGRADYKYSATMKEAGCISEAQSWEKMIRESTQTTQVETMEAAWSKENYQSCFQQSPNSASSEDNLDQPYEILNISGDASNIVWNDIGIFVFTLKVIDPDFSFCNLTVEFGVQVYSAESPMEEIPTFLVLGSSCLATIILLFSVYYTSVLCSN